jgi:hypothetical protein
MEQHPQVVMEVLELLTQFLVPLFLILVAVEVVRKVVLLELVVLVLEEMAQIQVLLVGTELLIVEVVVAVLDTTELSLPEEMAVQAWSSLKFLMFTRPLSLAV